MIRIESLLLRRVLAIALALAAIFAAWTFAVVPVLAAYDRYDADIARNRELLGRYLRISSGREALEAQVTMLQEARQNTRGFLHESKPELASAQLVRQVKALVENSGGNLQRTQIMPVKNDARSRRVTIRVFMAGTVEAVQKIFHGLETSEPYLFVDGIDIRANRRLPRRARRGNRVIAAQQQPLRVQFNVYGYLKPEVS